MAEERNEQTSFNDYRAVAQKNEFSHDLGVVVLPVAQRTAGHKKIRLHGGIAKRITRWRADRLGRPPLIPAATDTLGDTLLSSTVVPTLPTPNTEGPGYNWSISGEYVFVQDTPRVAGTDTFPVGQYPFQVEPAASYGEDLAGPYIPQYYDSVAEPADRLGSLMDQMVGVTPVDENGTWYWPFLALPSAFTSTHLIGG